MTAGLYKETVEMWTAFIFVILVIFKIVIDMGVVDRFCSNKMLGSSNSNLYYRPYDFL